ncbi:MAG TPA: universal stress protein [Dehalococcoidia bacterium]|jgi:nucleotide-binding universal stress UspA family protein
MSKKLLQIDQILVPLDGSREAEGVLPFVRALAPKFSSRVFILGVGVGQRSRRVNRLLDEYINRIANELHSHGVKAEPVILYGNAADKILDFTAEKEADLVIMATHGRSGITRWWMGSVAEKVISEATAPVLLVRSKRSKTAQTSDKRAVIHKILAPLDGSDIGEVALPYAEAIAAKSTAAVNLLQVISPPGTVEANLLGGPDWSKFVKAMHDAGENYLKSVSERLNCREAKVTYEVLTGDPADKIVEYAAANGVSLIAMSTHGRTGIARWVLGSVADKVLHGARIPILLVRSPKMIVAKSIH